MLLHLYSWYSLFPCLTGRSASCPAPLAASGRDPSAVIMLSRLNQFLLKCFSVLLSVISLLTFTLCSSSCYYPLVSTLLDEGLIYSCCCECGSFLAHPRWLACYIPFALNIVVYYFSHARSLAFYV